MVPVFLQHGTYGPVWHVDPEHMYSCVIASPKLAKKFHGMKSFIAYQLTPSVCMSSYSVKVVVWALRKGISSGSADSVFDESKIDFILDMNIGSGIVSYL